MYLQILFFFVGVIVMTLGQGLAAYWLWNWFVTPVFHFSHLPFWSATGITLLLSAVLPKQLWGIVAVIIKLIW